MHSDGAVNRTRRVGQAVTARRTSIATRNIRGTPMAQNEFLPFLAMCTVAAGVYSLACWIGWAF